MRRFVLLACATSVALVCLVGVQLTAHADSHRPPEAVLMKGEKELQKGRLGTYCWTHPGGGMCADALHNFPEAYRVGAGSTQHIRIKYAEQPTSVRLLTGSKVDERGEWYVGRTRLLATTLKPVLQEGQTVAWDAFFSVKRPDKHYYLTFGAHWGDGRGVSWDFHVQTRRDS